MKILRFLQEVDRRFLYIMILLVVSVPFFIKIKLPVKITPASQKLYDTIEAMPERSFVLLGVDWGAGTRGENLAQTIALMRHVMKKKLRFALLSFEPQSRTLAQNLAERLTKEYGYTEGKDWVNFGYKPDQENYLKAFVLDIPNSVGIDRRGLPVAGMPVMDGIKTARDIKLLLDVTPSDTYNAYIKFLQGSYQVPMGVACTSVITPEAVNRLDSGQIVGLIAGLQGAVEYEKLIDSPGKATSANISSSAAHFLIIAFILMGNIAMALERRQRAQTYGG